VPKEINENGDMLPKSDKPPRRQRNNLKDFENNDVQTQDSYQRGPRQYTTNKVQYINGAENQRAPRKNGMTDQPGQFRQQYRNNSNRNYDNSNYNNNDNFSDSNQIENFRSQRGPRQNGPRQNGSRSGNEMQEINQDGYNQRPRGMSGPRRGNNNMRGPRSYRNSNQNRSDNVS